MKPPRILSAALFLAAAAAPSLAQTTPPAADPPRLEEGARVRVATAQVHLDRVVTGSTRWYVGTVAAVDGAEISLRRDGSDETVEVTLPMDAVTRIEISHGAIDAVRSRTLSARRGALAGLAIFSLPLLIGVAATDGPDLKGTVPYLAVGSFGGMVLGGAFGGGSRERWVEVPKPDPGLALPSRPDRTPPPFPVN